MKTAAEIRDLLLSTGATLSTAESITAGHLQTLLTSVSKSSKFFMGGITAYQPEIKIELLGVDPDLARRTDCVDEEVSRQMASGALKLFRSDYALATCGYAEPYAERHIDQPFAYYAIAQRNGKSEPLILWNDRIELLGYDREQAQRKTARVVLEKFQLLLRNEHG